MFYYHTEEYIRKQAMNKRLHDIEVSFFAIEDRFEHVEGFESLIGKLNQRMTTVENGLIAKIDELNAERNRTKELGKRLAGIKRINFINRMLLRLKWIAIGR